mgnify:CR=1
HPPSSLRSNARSKRRFFNRSPVLCAPKTSSPANSPERLAEKHPQVVQEKGNYTLDTSGLEGASGRNYRNAQH